METSLKALIRPARLVPDEVSNSDTFGRFTAEPLERGFGATVGNSLRRILLSSIQGAAATSVRIAGVQHEFSHVPGAKEDVNDLILNLKQIVFKIEGVSAGETIYLDKKGPGPVHARDFECPASVRILNPDLVVAHLTSDAHLRMEVSVAQGRGYQPAVYQRMEDKDDIGIIPIDAVFSPIRNVRYAISNARVGQLTDYDRLVIEVSTNGAVRPDEAISYAAKILRDHLDLFMRAEEAGAEVIGQGPAGAGAGAGDEAERQRMREVLDKSIEELELSVRSFNCLEAAGIKTIRDLVQKTEGEMLKYRNFGRKSLSEIKQILKDFNLSFNMKLDEEGLPVMAPSGDKQ